jgi:hypothetical protein
MVGLFFYMDQSIDVKEIQNTKNVESTNFLQQSQHTAR